MANPAKTVSTKRVTLVGASIGKEWHFEALGQRLGRRDIRFDYSGTGQFDKGPIVQELLRRAEKPDIVLMKECSTYFPGEDPGRQKEMVAGWVEELRAAGVTPMLVTTAPVAKPSGAVALLKIRIKRWIGKPTWLESITSFNDWLKDYGRQEGVPVFDMESVLRQSPEDRWMRPDFDIGDTIHLNAKAYGELDREFGRFFAAWEKGAAR